MHVFWMWHVDSDSTIVTCITGMQATLGPVVLGQDLSLGKALGFGVVRWQKGVAPHRICISMSCVHIWGSLIDTDRSA